MCWEGDATAVWLGRGRHCSLSVLGRGCHCSLSVLGRERHCSLAGKDRQGQSTGLNWLSDLFNAELSTERYWRGGGGGGGVKGEPSLQRYASTTRTVLHFDGQL